MFDQEVTQIPGVLIGEVKGVDERGMPVVATGSVEVVAAHVLRMADAPRWRDCVGLRVAVAPVAGDEAQLVVLGLIDALPPARKEIPDALRVEGRREVVIECGKSKIAMRADGRIEIRGGHLISRSSGPNKIKGGSVHIN